MACSERTNSKKDDAPQMSGQNLRHSYPQVIIKIAWERPFYDPEANQLLQMIKKTKSIRAACALMGMSYTKGRSILTQIERQLGYPAAKSQQGGSTGGYSVLTKGGEELLSSYSAFHAEATQYIEDLFDRYFVKGDSRS